MNDNQGRHAQIAEDLTDMLVEIAHQAPDAASRTIRAFCNDLLNAMTEHSVHQEAAILALELEVILRDYRGLPQERGKA